MRTIALALAATLGLLFLGVFAVGWAVNQWTITRYEPQVAFNSRAWLSGSDSASGRLSVRQAMIRDLLANILPGKSKEEIEVLLGKSPTHEQMRRHSADDYKIQARDEHGAWKPFPKTGSGHYFDDLDWDLIYPIGCEQAVLVDHKGQLMSPDPEYLILRLDADGRFDSWYIEGSRAWPKVAGKRAKANYRQTRDAR